MTHPLLERALRFRHAVNSRERLRAFTASDCEVAEADVSVGLFAASSSPILAHPPRRWSDLDLATFLDEIGRRDRIAKVDLKNQRAFRAALPILREHPHPEKLMINADCALGPGGFRAAFSPEDLARAAKEVPGSLISIGSTTRPRAGPYKPRHVEALLAAVEIIGPRVTVAIRAESALANPSALAPLLDAGIKLTIWNSGFFSPRSAKMRERLESLWPDAWFDLA